jgi:hypothetical protein
VREAIKAAKSGITITAVNAPDDKFTPVFDGLEWCLTDVSPVLNRDLYSSYPLDVDTQLMDGIKVSKDSSDNKRVIVYDRALKVSSVVWQDNAAFSFPRSFHGFGLKVGTGTVLPESDWGSVGVLGGDCLEYGPKNSTYYPVANNWTDYESAMAEAGLHPSQGVKLDHSRVVINSASTNSNVAANGMYDFILAYYNPNADGSVAGSGLSASLPSWPASGLAFDGLDLPSGITSRNIGGITAASSDRKASAAGSYGTAGGGYNNQSFQAGEPRVDFVGNLTVPMANYVKSSLNVSSFANTNIIGDGDKWDSYISASSDIVLPPVTNVGLIGDYNGLVVNNRLGGRIRGILDITGTAPNTLDNDSINGYLNLWNIIGDMGVNRFYVISIKAQTAIQYVNKGGIWSSNPNPANVIIYPAKYNSAIINNEVSYLKPRHRAFFDGITPKITPTTNTSINVEYRGTDTTGSQQVPPLDEASWIDAANANNVAGAAPAFSSYSAVPKWDATAFNAVPVASAAP